MGATMLAELDLLLIAVFCAADDLLIRRNSVIEVWTPSLSLFRSSVMSAIITFMLEPAKLQMNCANASGRISRRADAPRRSRG
jgi:hypothetical protein